ncbi:hypothetical protein [Roseisolibacter sp. H3M3-2]|uniref:hypothetical protein n=1 Tax=Roseisolibacter sp. H3M3-2 TaxID=3031323 RepID=UPI0023DCC6D3|nr:hypothetical protein [Roseisolibacter sp. H3M3-2]MDF1501752.1 hypothetical protein [Roseisolibacter sp. H3M3-2]
MRPVSDRPLRPAAVGARAYSDAGAAVARAVARRTAELAARDHRQPPAAPALPQLAARPTPAGVESEVSIRVYADGGSISVVRHLRGAEVIGIEAVIR